MFFSDVLQMWYVTRYDDIVAVLRDPVRFSSADSVNGPVDQTPETRQAIAASYLSRASLTNNDPPSHTKVRRLVNKAFARRTPSDLEHRVRSIANELIDGFVDDGRAEIVRQFNLALPLRVILSVIGASQTELASLKQWSDDWIALLLLPMTRDEQAAAVSRLWESQRFWTSLIEERTAVPRDDLLSDLLLVSSEEDEPLETLQIVNVCAVLALAGHETTTNLLGICLLRLLGQPDLWRALCDDSSLIPGAVEETLRADTSVQALMRTTTEPVEVGGVALPEGARLALLFASANHDEAYFPDAATFDIHRQRAKPHLAFGQGIHHCVGAQLARLEGRVALELLAARLPGLRLTDGQEHTWVVNPVHRGLQELHVEWDP